MTIKHEVPVYPNKNQDYIGDEVDLHTRRCK